MEIFQIKNLSFTYPARAEKAVEDVSFSVKAGEFLLLCGGSGCGKTTLLRLLKSSLAPHGSLEGEVLFHGKPLSGYDVRSQAAGIGFVMQDPDNQLVTDKVWHELAFGLESLGMSTQEIRARVSEMASFFGIENWFYQDVIHLSGGQKQLLNLASVMVMQPEVLILDEPTSQLDPIAAGEFLGTVEKINRELGTTVILTEHRLEEAFPLADRVLVMDGGRLIADAPPEEAARFLAAENHRMCKALPTPVRVHSRVANRLPCPITVRSGRKWLEEYSSENPLNPDAIPQDHPAPSRDTAVELSEVRFRYEKEQPDVLRGLDLRVEEGELFCILGGNGSGKSTVLSLICGLNTPCSGKIRVKDVRVCMLPQDPQSVFTEKTLRLDLMDMLSGSELTAEEREKRIVHTASMCGVSELLGSHPYDLSGGEQQRAALAKVLLGDPGILLLDEPTKGMDAHFKEEFAGILAQLRARGVTVIMVSHDIEFCAEYADRCALVFDGGITSTGTPREFFKGKSFYTTAANRMARGMLPEAVLAEDIIRACGGDAEKHGSAPAPERERVLCEHAEPPCAPRPKRTMDKRAAVYIFMFLLLIPATVYAGVRLFGNRRYYLTSLAVMLEAMLPFFLLFEARKPKAREIVVISVMCAAAVAGRAALPMLPQFKPMAAIVIISGACLGCESGFLVGAVSAFLSNFFLGQGPWTPWQMFALGLIGFLAGLLFGKGGIPKKRIPLCIFGAVSAFAVYGGIMDPASVIMWQDSITREMLISAYAMGFSFNLIHGISTGFFIFILSRPIIEKLERIKIKYGFIGQ